MTPEVVSLVHGFIIAELNNRDIVSTLTVTNFLLDLLNEMERQPERTTV